MHRLHKVTAGVFDWGQHGRHRPRADAVAAYRGVHVERFVRALVVVAMSPVIKKLLGVLQVAEDVHRKHFCLEAAVEALVFAVGLRVVGAAEAQADAQAYRQTASCVRPPRLPQGAPLSMLMRSGRPYCVNACTSAACTPSPRSLASASSRML